MITYPARPYNGGYYNPTTTADTLIYRPKIDGDRVMLNVETKEMFNRKGDKYTKGKDIPFDEIMEVYGDHITSEWLDCEWMDKHALWKKRIAILDEPLRGDTFIEMLKRLHPNHECFSIRNNPMPRAGFNILHLPWWRSAHGITPYFWEQLKTAAKEIMQQHNETTPIIEGIVGVRESSYYPKQISNPNKTAIDWVKHRFSN